MVEILKGRSPLSGSGQRPTGLGGAQRPAVSSNMPGNHKPPPHRPHTAGRSRRVWVRKAFAFRTQRATTTTTTPPHHAHPFTILKPIPHPTHKGDINHLRNPQNNPRNFSIFGIFSLRIAAVDAVALLNVSLLASALPLFQSQNPPVSASSPLLLTKSL